MFQPIQRIRRDKLSDLDQKLHDAVSSSDYELVIYFLSKKGNPMSVDQDGMNTLHIAAIRGHVGIFRLLLNVKGADTKIASADIHDDVGGGHPIHYAAYYGHAEIVKEIIAFDKGATVNEIDGCGMSPLHEAIAGSHPACIEELLRHQETNINIETEDRGVVSIPIGSTPLFYAIYTDEPVIVGMLVRLKKFLDPGLPNDLANDQNYIEYDECVFPDDGNVLSFAARLGKLEIVRILLERATVKLVNQYDSRITVYDENYGGMCAFDYAIDSELEDCILLFLRSNKVTDKNPVVNFSKMTLLEKAVYEGWVRVIECLANTNAEDFADLTSRDESLVQLAFKNNQDSLKKLTELQNAKRIEIDPNAFDPHFTAKSDLRRTANKVRRAIYEIDWSLLKSYKNLPDAVLIEMAERLIGCSADELSSVGSDDSCLESELESGEEERESYIPTMALGPEMNDGCESECDSQNNDDFASRYIESIKQKLLILSTKSNDNPDNLPPLAAAYKKGDIKSAQLLHKFSGIDIRRPLPGMKDPGSYIDENNQALKKLRDEELARPFGENSTAGSSSFPSIVGGRKLQASALIPGTSEQNITPDVQKLLDDLNHKIQNKESIDYDDYPFVVVHFRGINFTQKYFPKVHGKESFFSSAQNMGIHSPMSYAISGITLGKELTSEEDARLNEIDQQVFDFWRSLAKKQKYICYWKKKDKTKMVFEKLNYLMQERYTNMANKTFEKTEYIDIWEEIWDYFKRRDLLKVYKTNKIKKKKHLKKSPIISFGKTPGHAVRYAVGRSLSGQYRSTRADSRMRNTGQSKHRLIGAVYIVLHSLQDYFEAKVSDTSKLHKKRQISVHVNYLNETEVAFPGGVTKEHIAKIFPVYWPTFRESWRKLDDETKQHYSKFYGLNKEKYKTFRDRSRATVRPEEIDYTIFEHPWQEKYLPIHGIDATMFKEFKELLNCHPSKPEEISEYKNKALKLGNKIKRITRNQDNPLRNENIYKNKERINHDEVRNTINKILRDINPYRVLKNELRDHFGGYRDPRKRKFIGGHVSKLLLDEAFKHANQRRQYLVYRNADGLFYFYDKDPDQVKSKIVKSAKKHPENVKRKSPKKATSLADNKSAPKVSTNQVKKCAIKRKSTLSLDVDRKDVSIPQGGFQYNLNHLYNILTDPLGLSQIVPVESDDKATDHGLEQTMQHYFSKDAHILQPSLGSVSSLMAKDPVKINEALKNYGERICGYTDQDGVYHNNGFIGEDGGELKKPIIIIINTISAVAETKKDVHAEGDGHWVTCVILPKRYSIGDKVFEALTERVFFIDSLFPNSRLPQCFKDMLIRGHVYHGIREPSNKESQGLTQLPYQHLIPPSFPKAQFIDLLNKPQQLGGLDCGWWAFYNALMIVMTGSGDYVNNFKERSRNFAYKLRALLPSLSDELIPNPEAIKASLELRKIKSKFFTEHQSSSGVTNFAPIQPQERVIASEGLPDGLILDYN